MRLLKVQAMDILDFRGNRLFSEGGSSTMMPPLPSVFAGAIRSKIMVDQGIDFRAFKEGNAQGSKDAEAVIGKSPEKPGSFSVSFVGYINANDEIYVQPPSDMFVVEDNGQYIPYVLKPSVNTISDSSKIKGSFNLPWALRADRSGPGEGNPRSKPVSGLLLSLSGMLRHLQGKSLESKDFCRVSEFYQLEPRTGIALDHESRSVKESMIYSSESICFQNGCGFAVALTGTDNLPLKSGLLRLGGEGRGASLIEIKDIAAVAKLSSVTEIDAAKIFTMTLAAPGLFNEGWLPPLVSIEDRRMIFEIGGMKAELIAAAIGRNGVISGWDLVENRPKKASKVVPAGSVYWFQKITEPRQGWADKLQIIAQNGLFDADIAGDIHLQQRRAEGFNRVWFGISTLNMNGKDGEE